MRRSIYILVALCLALSALAQAPQPPGLTWVRYYEAQPGKEMEFARLLSESSKSVFDKLIADKKVAAWGIVVPVTHIEGETYTHAAYVTVPDWAALEAMISAFEANDATMPPAEMKKLDDAFMAALKPGSIRDVILRHLSQAPLATAPPTTRPKYIGVDTYVIKQGRGMDAVSLFNEWGKPLFTDVAAKGKFGPWGLSMQEIQTRGDWTHMIWYFMNDLSAVDQLNAGTMALDPMKLKGYDVRLRDMSEPEKHRTSILRIVYQAP